MPIFPVIASVAEHRVVVRWHPRITITDAFGSPVDHPANRPSQFPNTSKLAAAPKRALQLAEARARSPVQDGLIQ